MIERTISQSLIKTENDTIHLIEIDYRKLGILVIEVITIFLTVAVMGLAIQVIGLIQTDRSILGIISLTVILYILAIMTAYGT